MVSFLLYFSLSPPKLVGKWLSSTHSLCPKPTSPVPPPPGPGAFPNTPSSKLSAPYTPPSASRAQEQDERGDLKENSGAVRNSVPCVSCDGSVNG